MKYSKLIDMKDEEFRRMIGIKKNTFPKEVRKGLQLRKIEFIIKTFQIESF
jgi:hypothetical protein